MKKWWTAVALVVTAGRITHAAEPGNGTQTIDLRMDNDARVPAFVLEQSQDEVRRIFAGSGLTVRWTDTASKFTVMIVPQVLGYGRAGSPVMGVAFRKADGSMAQVFFKQVQNFAATYGVDLSVVLAHVIAHEVGHLLLPGTPHSAFGIMRSGWDNALARDLVKGTLTFTDAQAATIRARHTSE